MSKGFTLLELLIVIAILAILTTVLVLNPAEYLAQARDAQRLSDISTLNSAISLYLSSVSTISLTCGATATSTYCTGGSQGSTYATPNNVSLCTTVSTSTAVGNGSGGGLGWLPIDFKSLSAGSPIAKEPIDPSNTANLKYAYNCNATSNVYELDARMESAKYKNGGTGDLESKDGGNASTTYEMGTDLTTIN
jgi:type IV pilus assembly protein PilA